MKKTITLVALGLSVAAFAQKEELKTLKKIYSKDKPSANDIETFKTALEGLETKATEEADKVNAKFFRGMLPFAELSTLTTPTPADLMKIFNPNALNAYVDGANAMLDYEKKTGKRVYSDEIEQQNTQLLRPQLSAAAGQMYNAKQYKVASEFYYILYRLDKKDGSMLENAAIVALQGEDYVSAEKLYEEYYNSDFLNNGSLYFAVNKASGEEERFSTREERSKMITLGTHEKPREIKNNSKKPEVIKILSGLAVQNGNKEKAKKIITEARATNPNDEALKATEAELYYNDAYEILQDEDRIVGEINNNRDNEKKYNALLNERKELFKKALPSLEKAYSINPNNPTIKDLLKSTYTIIGEKAKADAIK